MYLAIPALLVNWWFVSQDERPAEAFGGGRVLELHGPDVNVRQFGAGPSSGAIVLLHGYAGSAEWWAAVAPKLAEETGRKVIAIDMVGHGGSESPKESRAYGAVGQALAVRRALAALEVGDVVLLGHSMGGGVATLVAEQEPDLVDRVAVIDTMGAAGLVEDNIMKSATCWPVVGEALDRLRTVDAVTKPSLETGFADGFGVPPFAYTSLKTLTHRGLCKSNANLQLNKQQPIAERLADLGKPVLVVWGAQDKLTPMATNVAAYRAAGIQAEIIQGSGHSPQVEKPKKLVKLLAEFVR